MTECYTKKFKDAKRDDREGSVCWYVLPEGIVSRIEAGWVEVPPGGKNVSKGHTEWRQVFFILEGKGKIVLDGSEEIDVEAPMVMEIPYDRDHDAVASHDVPLKYLYVNDYSIAKKGLMSVQPVRPTPLARRIGG